MPDLSPGAPGFQVVIEERVIIRVPARRMPLNSFATQQVTVTERRAPPPMVWREVKGPKCLPMRSVLGVQAATRDSIDIITRERQRLRAQLNRGCRGLDFYSGFYMQGTRDGRLCADRDPIHARSGMQCEINRFRLLVPEGARD